MTKSQSNIDALKLLRIQIQELISEEYANSLWLVGGAVRDALLQRKLLDIDLVVDGNARSVAQHIAKNSGGSLFVLGERSNQKEECWRITLSTNLKGSTVNQIDICSLKGSNITEDLAARDFTVNALAVPISGEFNIIDNHGGTVDIEQNVLRMVSTEAFDDDPLRMLRAARIAHQLGWEIDADTISAIRIRKNHINNSAGERIFAELSLLLLEPEVKRGWNLLSSLSIDEILLPELAACKGIKQSHFHHLDVHDHTLAALDNCEDLLLATDFWLPLDAEDQLSVDPWNEQQKITVLLSALCHDLGKPAVHKKHDDGRVSFTGHDDTGRIIVEGIAQRWRWSTKTKKQVSQLVGTHLDLGYLLHGSCGLKERWQLRQKFGDVTAEAVVLSVADRLATAGYQDRRRWVRAHLELARAVWKDYWLEQKIGVPAPLLDGIEIAEAAKIQPGPALGKLVFLLAQAQAVGEVKTVEQARSYITTLSNESLILKP